MAPYALNNPALLIVLKSIRGDVSSQDWNDYRRRMESVNMNWDNQRATTILTYHARSGVKIDKRELLKTLEALDQRTTLGPMDGASLGYFLMNDLDSPDAAVPYFIKAINAINPNDPFAQQLGRELRDKGRPDLAERVEEVQKARLAQTH